MKPVSDQHIIKGCLNNDRKMQKMLYEKYFAYGMSIAYRYAKNKDDAKWLLNQSFMQVFENISSFDSAQDFKPWFRRLLINRILNENKRYYREVRQEIPEYTDEFDNDILSQLSYQEIINEIQALTPAYRIVLNMYIIDGYKHEEIAKELGISVGSSKSNLSRAKTILKERLTKKLGIVRK